MNTRIKPIIPIFSILFLSSLVRAQDVKVVSFKELSAWMDKENDTTYVINFWATWCSPCVEELPHFEAMNEKFGDKKIKVILVSLDFKSQLTSKVTPFIEKKNIRSTVLLLDEPDANSYIDQVSPEWSGAIPATLIVNSQKKIRQFHEKKFSYDELLFVIKPLIERK